MRRALIARLLLLSLLLSLLISPALADPCVQCGKEAGEGEYLCTSCLVSMLETTPANLSLRRICRDYWGHVRVQWNDPDGNAPYRVTYRLLHDAPVPFGWTDAEGITTNHHTLTRLAPGVGYVITVEDAAGHTLHCTWQQEPATMAQSIGAKLLLDTAVTSPEGLRQLTAFTLSQLASDNSHQLAVQPIYSRLAYGHLYSFHLTVTAPNGFTDVVYSGDLDLGPGQTHLETWDHIPMDGYFGYLTRYYGGVPTGAYRVTLYLNGAEAANGCFTIAE